MAGTTVVSVRNAVSKAAAHRIKSQVVLDVEMVVEGPKREAKADIKPPAPSLTGRMDSHCFDSN